MERRKGRRGRGGGWLALCLSYTLQLTCAADLSYSVSEELQAGSVVGNLAKDLEMDVRRIAERNLRVVRDSATQYFEVDAASGTLVIREPVDRERICAQSSACFLHLQIVLEDPLEMKRATVEIADVNDNAPQFLADNITLEVSEAAAPGASFRLEGAHDPDVGVNSLRTYMLSPNECFALNVLSKSDGTKFPELVLEKPLDREKQATFRLLLTAVDGGRPERSGTTVVNVKVLDVNDNAPVFEQPVLKVSLAENTPVGTVVAQLNATDVDAGPNGEISFLFSKYTPDAVLRIFSVDPHKGEVKVIGELDYEAAAAYDITVQARDNGNPAMEGSCNIKVEVKDVNDNAPQVSVTSLTSPVREDVAPGTVIAFLKVSDADSGKNGEVTLRIPAGLPFRLTSPFKEHYTVVTDGPLDREAVAEHIIVVTATDGGNPALTAQTRLAVSLSDVNDNAPTFSQPSYSVDVLENNSPGALLLTLSASDPDAGENSRLSFFMLPGSVQGSPLFSFMSMDSESGRIHATRSLDHEEHSLIRFEVQVRDAGSPPRSSNVTVHVFVIDQNDNAPVILYPPEPRTLRLPRTASAGYLVGKITGLDTDSGYNAWLGYSIAPGPHAAHFRIDRYSGELRTVRRLEEEEELEEGSTYSLVVVVKDNGEPSLSTNATITITVEEPSSNSATNTRQTSGSSGLGDITLYLIISLACVSAVAVLTAAVLLVRCLRRGCEDPDWDSWHCGRRKVRSRHHTQQRAQKNLHLQLNTDGPIKYVEVVGGPAEAHTRTYRPCYSTLSSRSDFVFVKTPMMSHNNTLSMTLTRKPLPSMLSEQKPPNTDWRFSQNQRPGPSGAAAAVGGPPEAAAVGTGPWPNPPTEAEQLQALMAAANEVSEATATLGPGTMGLSTRYSPQFTLQHVPDYRQNVYIPGSTATLTANPPQQALPPPQQAPPPAQAEAPKAAQTPASKKKSAKKEKK